MMMQAVQADLAALNISFDIFFSERSLVRGAVDQVAATIVQAFNRFCVPEAKQAV
jgi:arginyl-tRNA synthetase